MNNNSKDYFLLIKVGEEKHIDALQNNELVAVEQSN